MKRIAQVIQDIAKSVAIRRPDVGLGGPTARAPLLNLLLVSFAALYIEMMVVRWIGTEVGVFAYFQNLALIACFLGFGLGCYWSNRRSGLAWSLRALMGLLVLVYFPVEGWWSFEARLSNTLSLSPDAVLWGSTYIESGSTLSIGLLFLASTGVVACFLGLLVLVMIPLGQWVGFYLDRARNPLLAYSVNLVGSVAGIWVFAAIAYFRLPPGCWFAGAVLTFLVLNPPSPPVGAAIMALLVIATALFTLQYSRSQGIHWSPYQKIQVVAKGDQNYDVFVNNKGYMTIANATPEFLIRHPEVAERLRTESSYDAPFRFASKLTRVLIVGAGAGNDAAAALRHGAEYVDAVEIDPVIYSIGQRLHADHPYSSPKVNVILNDARAFLRDSKAHYDVILFGLLDSHTQFSDYSNMRIDNYVYTQEAFQEAAHRLNGDGILVVKFEIREPWTWMGQRFYAALRDLFHRPPVVFYAPIIGKFDGATVFITSPDPNLWRRSAEGGLSQLIHAHPLSFDPDRADPPPPTTDDWPYIYHRTHSIPRTYLFVSLLLLAIAFLLVGRTFKPRDVSTWGFFFLGAGFMLLETQLISRLALYFGTTWGVTSVVLTAVLLVLVVANTFVGRFRPKNLRPYSLLLVGTLAANYLFPWEGLPFSARVVGMLLCLTYSFSLFFAGVIFGEAFRLSQEKSGAFGANIFGAVAGGLAQNISFLFGMKILLPLAAVLYVAAALCGWTRIREQQSLAE